MLLWMDLTLLNVLLKISRWTGLGLNGQRKKGEELNMIAMQKTSSHHLWTWMSSLGSPNARVQRKCGMYLKSHERGRMMWRDTKAKNIKSYDMPFSSILNVLLCRWSLDLFHSLLLPDNPLLIVAIKCLTTRKLLNIDQF